MKKQALQSLPIDEELIYALQWKARCRDFMLFYLGEHEIHLRKSSERKLMKKHSLHVSIIGGGIGGLSTAAALQRQGIQVTVFERNPELREIGAGLTLWANGVQVLRQLGLADALAAVSAPLTHFECWSWRGNGWAACDWTPSNDWWEPPALASTVLI